MQLDRRSALAAVAAFVGGLWRPKTIRGQTLAAGPGDYLQLVARLGAGDELRLEPGIYRGGLNLADLHGTAAKPIVIRGPADRSARFHAQAGRSTVDLREVSYLEIRDLTLDGRNAPRAHGVESNGVSHHISLENLEIVNHAAHQQTVGISTKAPAWSWTIRGTIIRGAGTGIYLGNSNGACPFVQGLVEHNLIADTIGYGLQIKHQIRRPDLPGMPTQPGSTIIRRNIISKARQPQAGFQGPRPNLLVGHLPPQGPGVEDAYEIYGNLLYQNLVNEPLFQGEGNFAFHDNLLVNHHGDGIWIQPHNDRPRKVAVFHNTVVAKGAGIRLVGADPGFEQLIMQNAIFAARPMEGGTQRDNLAAAYGAAGDYLRTPFGDWAVLDLRPRRGRLQLQHPAAEPLMAYEDADKDFAGNLREHLFFGAYAGPDVPRQDHLRFPTRL